MNELNKISNEALLKELNKRLDKGEIIVEGSSLMAETEDKNGFFSVKLRLDIVWELKNYIQDLREDKILMRKEKEKWEEEYFKIKKMKLENLTSENQTFTHSQGKD